MLLKVRQGFKVDYFINEVVKNLLQVDPNAVFSQLGVW
jgi:hypothetical protein